VGKKLIIGNWKMNLTIHEASLYAHKLADLVKIHQGVEVVLAPSHLALQPISLQINYRQFKLAAQNFYWRDEGAFTGEISAHQLRGLVQYALVGHSERRHIFNEHDKDTRHKVQAAYRNGIVPVLCVGETVNERVAGETRDVLHDQVTGGLANITSEEAAELVIAYEPVWAVGTGNNASPTEVRAAAKMIRTQLKHLFGEQVAESVRILYGGSVTLDTAASYLSIQGIDGLLIGGASLDAHVFSTIINNTHDQLKGIKERR
jgi:triosephosphate isomerase